MSRVCRNEKVSSEKEAAATAHAQELEQLTQKVALHDEEMGRLKLAAAADVECKSARIKELEGEMEKTNASALQTWVTGLEPDSRMTPVPPHLAACA